MKWFMFSRIFPDKEKSKIHADISLTAPIKEYFLISLIVILTSVICFQFSDIIDYQVISFILLFLVSILALFYGPGPVLLAATLSALIWDFFFIPPHFTLQIGSPEDTLMLIMFFIIALISGALTSGVRKQEQKIRAREERTRVLYQLTKELNLAAGIEETSAFAAGLIEKYLQIKSIIILANEPKELAKKIRSATVLPEKEIENAIEIFKNGKGKFFPGNTIPSYVFYPLIGSSGNLGLIITEPKKKSNPADEQFSEAFISQISAKLEREFLRKAARDADILNESDKLYRTLFNSISHELRIPVSAILGYSDLLLTLDYPEDTRIRLYKEINTASVRLNRLIENLLNISRLDSGRITLHTDWVDLHDLVNLVTENLKEELQPFKLSVIIPDNMPLVLLDFGLMEQVLHNILLNATQYSPPGTFIRSEFSLSGENLLIKTTDQGRGFSESELTSVFNKFFRGQDSKVGGIGLGLSIVKGFVEAHGGMVSAENPSGGGSLLMITIPVKITEIT